MHPRPPLDNQVDIRVLVVIICKGPLSTKCDLHPLHSLAFVMLLLLSLAWKKAIITALTPTLTSWHDSKEKTINQSLIDMADMD